MLIAFSYLKTVNGSLQRPISFKVPTCVPLTALLIILLFSNRLTKFSFNSYKFCSFQQDPVLQEDWKSTGCLGRRMSPSTLRTLLSEGYYPLLEFHTSLHFTSHSLPVSCLFLPITVPSFFSSSHLSSPSFFIFCSPFHCLTLPCSFPSHSSSLILHPLSLHFYSQFS